MRKETIKLFDDEKLRELLLHYDVGEPNPELVAKTKCLMRTELLHYAAEPLKPENMVFMLVGLAVVMSLCLFYMFTVGTILGFVLPSYLLKFLEYSLYTLTAAGGSLLACALIILFFKQFYAKGSVETVSNV